MEFNLDPYSLDSGFYNLNCKATSLIPLLQKYPFDDLVTAIYSITSWRDNRSAQESCLALNSALIQTNVFGRETIQSYDEFCSFFTEIEPILKISHLDDFVVNDFGEVQLLFNNNFYPIITGTGHTGSVYAALQYLEELSLQAGRMSQCKDVLQYMKTMIDFLISTNESRYADPKIVFDVPTEEYFHAVKGYLRTKPTELLNCDSIKSFINLSQPIVKTHFIQKSEAIYPLFYNDPKK